VVVGHRVVSELTDRCLDGVPEGSRASRGSSLFPEWLTEDNLRKLRALNEIAARRGQYWLSWRSPGRCAIRGWTSTRSSGPAA